MQLFSTRPQLVCLNSVYQNTLQSHLDAFKSFCVDWGGFYWISYELCVEETLASDNEVFALSFLSCLSLLSSRLKTLLSGFCPGSDPSSPETGSLWLRLLQLSTLNVSQLIKNQNVSV